MNSKVHFISEEHQAQNMEYTMHFECLDCSYQVTQETSRVAFSEEGVRDKGLRWKESLIFFLPSAYINF
jgi:hypothetical protein